MTAPTPLQVGRREATLDLARGVILHRGAAIPLSETDRRVLAVLASQPGAAVDRARLAACMRAGRPVHETSVTTAIHRLRMRLDATDIAITTVIGQGYRLEIDAVRPDGVEGQPIGRAADLGRLARGPAVQWVVGPGGVGKTTLLRAFAASDARWLAGPVWVDLADAADHSALMVRVADALALASGGTEPVDALAARTAAEIGRRKSTLVVLDAAEHVADDVARWLDSLSPGPATRVLVASRRAPRAAQSVLVLSPLTQADARTLLAVRIHQARLGRTLRPDELPAAHAIADAVGGLPLALEIAACRVARESVEEVRARLVDPLATLDVHDGPWQPQQRSLRRVLEDSLHLLSPAEQALLLALCLLARPIVAAEAAILWPAASPDAVEHLVAAGWLRRAAGPRPTFRMPDPVQTFLRGVLTEHADRRSITQAFTAFVCHRVTRWLDPREDTRPTDHAAALLHEAAAVRAALDRATDPREAALLWVAMGQIAVRRGPREALEVALASCPPSDDPLSLAALVAHRRAVLADLLGQPDAMEAALARGIDAAERGLGLAPKVRGVWGREREDAGRLLVRLLTFRPATRPLVPAAARARLRQAQVAARSVRDRELVTFVGIRLAANSNIDERYAEALEALDTLRTSFTDRTPLLNRMHLAAHRAVALTELGAADEAVAACAETHAWMVEAEHRLDLGLPRLLAAIVGAEIGRPTSLEELDAAKTAYLAFGRTRDAALAELIAALVCTIERGAADPDVIASLAPRLELRHRAWAEGIYAYLRGSASGIHAAEARLDDLPWVGTRSALAVLRGEAPTAPSYRVRLTQRLKDRLEA